MAGAFVLGQPACHTGCEYDIVPEGTRFVVTVVSPSPDCPEIVPLRAGHQLTLEAGGVFDDGTCESNFGSEVPPELPQYPDGPFVIESCSPIPGGGLGFECSASAPDCVGEEVAGGGTVRATVGGLPQGDEVLNTEYLITVSVGGKASCLASCFTKVPITIQRE